MAAVSAKVPFKAENLSADFAEVPSRLLSRFSQEEQRTAKHLSAVVFFDRELFERLTTGPVATGTAVGAFGDFVKLSFVERSSASEYSIHRALRMPLLAEMERGEPQLLTSLRAIQRAYWTEQGLLGGTHLVVEGLERIHSTLRGFALGTVNAKEVEALLAGDAVEEAWRAAQDVKSHLAQTRRKLDVMRQQLKEREEEGKRITERAREAYQREFGEEAPPPADTPPRDG